ncbi:transposase family protein [Sulfurimonas sediminis]|uniref:Transposase family protein n=1 Tax=Sulfurimonas sediminis TaxID=2590020 RepID=A0A7M1B616_9BACT|nr:hypothetical protein [Sulfurimonas sediminis]QOP44198.1 transposase family protein [Sulfurimonas sediminis]
MATKTREKLAKKRSIRGYADQAQSNQLLKLFSEVTDYRKPQGKRHRLGACRINPLKTNNQV